MAFQGNALDKLKKMISLKKQIQTKKREVENKDGEMLCHPQRHKQSAALRHFRNGPKPGDDTFHSKFRRVVAKRVLRCWRQVVLPTRTMNYTPRLGCFPFTGSIIC
jgi:hypothetical protein